MAFTYNEIRSSIKTNKDITLQDNHRAKVPSFSYYIKGITAYGDLCYLTERA